ncbi:MAG: fructose-bisphosphatase class II [Candidatus Zixiibacteriota bacterium]
MSDDLRFNIGDQRLSYQGGKEVRQYTHENIMEFNQRHHSVLSKYSLELVGNAVTTIDGRINNRSNLGALRNRQLREAVKLSAALSAMAVGLHGFGSWKNVPEAEQTNDKKNELKRANDRTAAQIMAEVLQTTTESLPVGEEVVIESTITEGVRVKPGKEAGGNPTIAVGALFGKKEHRSTYGLKMPESVTLLTMGNDVVEGTGKSVAGQHSSMTTLFISESGVKRHLPDIYVQRWMSGAYFEEFDPREASVIDAAEVIAKAYGMSGIDKLSAFFLNRKRHHPAMDDLNANGVATPFDQDGDLFPSILLGLDGLKFPNGRGLHSMIGEIGGSAEWAVGVLPLIWRGGQAIGMLTSQSSLTKPNMTPEKLWAERFHYTEDEFIQIQDGRFEHKPYFTVKDIMEDPFAGGIAAFGAISDNYFYPDMKGVTCDRDKDLAHVNVFIVNSLGVMELWSMTFKCLKGIDCSIEKMVSPKEMIENLRGSELMSTITEMLADQDMRKRFRIFFSNEYYPALIPVRDKMVLLHRTIDALIERKALAEVDREITSIVEDAASEWFISAEG